MLYSGKTAMQSISKFDSHFQQYYLLASASTIPLSCFHQVVAILASTR